MSVVRRPWFVLVLLAFAILGALLVVTADDDAAPPELEPITTAEGLQTQVPVGWEQVDGLAFDFVPADDPLGFERWTVASACPSDGCGGRSLDDWMALAAELPTFAQLGAADADIFNLETERLDNALVMRGDTRTGGRLVFAAHFVDGAATYVECAVRLGLQADQRLGAELVDVCRTTAPID